MRVLIPELPEDAAPLATALRAKGHEVLAISSQTYSAADAPLNLAGAQAFLVASPVAARALAEKIGVRTFPVFADSAVTGDALRRAGFKQIEAAHDARDLANIIGNRLRPATGALIYPCAAGAPSNLMSVLTNMGFAVRPVALYALDRIDAPPQELRDALAQETLDVMVFTTAESARALVTVLQRSGLGTSTGKVGALAANTTVAAPLRALPFSTITIPPGGDEESLMEAVAHVEAERLALENQRRREAETAAEMEGQRLAAEREATLALERRQLEAEAAEVHARQEQEQLKAEQEAARAAEAEQIREQAAERERKRLEAERKARAEDEARQRRAAAEAAEREQRRLEAERVAEQIREEDRRRREAEAARTQEQERLKAEHAAALAAEQEARRRQEEQERIAAEQRRREQAAAEMLRITEQRAVEARAAEDTERRRQEMERDAEHRAAAMEKSSQPAPDDKTKQPTVRQRVRDWLRRVPEEEQADTPHAEIAVAAAGESSLPLPDPVPVADAYVDAAARAMVAAASASVTDTQQVEPSDLLPPEPLPEPPSKVPQPPPSARLLVPPVVQPGSENVSTSAGAMNEQPPSPPESADGSDQSTDSGELVKPRGGRAARLHAEDAADAVRTPRWRPFTDTDTNTDEPPLEKPRRSRASGVVFFVVVVLAIAASHSLWLPRLKDAITRVGPRPAPVVATPSSQETPAQSPGASPAAEAAPQQSAAALLAQRQEIDQKLAAIGETAGTDPLASQATHLASVSARVASLESAIGNSAHLDDVSRRLSALEGKSADAASVLALADRVNALENTSRSAMAIQTGRVALVLALGQWREALAAGRPFALELESVKAVAEHAGQTLNGLDDPRFASRAPAGIAPLALLRENFDETAAHVTRAAAVPGGFEGFWGRSLERLMSIFTVRRVNGMAEGNSPSAILARAGAYLNQGDLVAAVTEMEHLEGGAAVAAQPWLEEARARIAAEQVSGDASTKAVAALGALGAAATPATGSP